MQQYNALPTTNQSIYWNDSGKVYQKNFLEYLLQTNNNSLVHYSFSAKGSALYYQKIMLNKIARSMLRGSYLLADGINSPSRQATRYLELRPDFQQAYYWMSVSNQIRRGISPSIWGNDTWSVGTFKNKSALRTANGSHSTLLRSQEPRMTSNSALNYWSISVAWKYSDFLFNEKRRGAESVLPMKGTLWREMNKSSKIKSNIWKYNYKFKSFLQNMSLTISCMTHFVRSLWYNLTLSINNATKPVDNIDNVGRSAVRSIKRSAYSFMYAADFDYDSFLTIGSFDRDNYDLLKDISPSSKLYRRKVKNQKHWRLGMAVWARKIWQFKKGYRFWRYMRGMSFRFLRGYYGWSVFMNRVDVYGMRMFSIKNLRLMRCVLKSGHLFYGTYPTVNSWIRVSKFGILSLSKAAVTWTTNRGVRKFNLSSSDFNRKTAALRNVKNAALRYCRQHKYVSFWGRTSISKFVMYYGMEQDAINMDSKKTNFFSLSYSYGQRSIASAWW